MTPFVVYLYVLLFFGAHLEEMLVPRLLWDWPVTI